MFRTLTVFLMASLFAMPATGQVSAEPSLAVRSLKGLSTVALIIEPIDPAFIKAGADTAAMRKSIEQSLRQKGLTVDDVARSSLHVSIRTAPTADGMSFPYAYRIEFKQPAYIVSQANVLVQLPTWGFDGVGVVGKAGVPEQATRMAARLIEAFLKDWDVVNPGMAGGELR